MNRAVLICWSVSSVSYGELGSRVSALNMISRIDSTIERCMVKLILGRFSLSPASSASSLLLCVMSTVMVSPTSVDCP